MIGAKNSKNNCSKPPAIINLNSFLQDYHIEKMYTCSFCLGVYPKWGWSWGRCRSYCSCPMAAPGKFGCTWLPQICAQQKNGTQRYHGYYQIYIVQGCTNRNQELQNTFSNCHCMHRYTWEPCFISFSRMTAWLQTYQSSIYANMHSGSGL